jgi:hypothetical protein
LNRKTYCFGFCLGYQLCERKLDELFNVLKYLLLL